MKVQPLKSSPAKTYMAVKKNEGTSIYRQVRKDLDKKFKR